MRAADRRYESAGKARNDAMTTARLVVDLSSVSFRPLRPATGNISLLLGGVVFPTDSWNDFVIVVVEAWLTALVRLARHTSASERVHFMEGPYAVDITRLPTGEFRLRAFERPSTDYALIEVSASMLVEDAIAVADAILRMCRTTPDRSADVDKLELALLVLRKEAPRITS